jgi:hypothetical protein
MNGDQFDDEAYALCQTIYKRVRVCNNAQGLEDIRALFRQASELMHRWEEHISLHHYDPSSYEGGRSMYEDRNKSVRQLVAVSDYGPELPDGRPNPGWDDVMAQWEHESIAEKGA